MSYFHKMLSEGLFDKSVLYAPHSHGMELPAYYQTHLEPFTQNKVLSPNPAASQLNAPLPERPFRHGSM